MTYHNLSLGALSDPTRRAVLEQLRRKPRTVGEIAGQLPVSRPAVSQHLRALAGAGLVTERREGTRHYFSLNPATLMELRRYFEGMWQDSMQAYARYVEQEEVKRARQRKPNSKRGSRGNNNH